MPSFIKTVNGVESPYSLINSQTINDVGIYSVGKISGIDGYIGLFLEFSGPVYLNIQFFINGVLVRSSSTIAYNNLHLPINKFTITNACRLRIVVNGLAEAQKIAVFAT